MGKRENVSAAQYKNGRMISAPTKYKERDDVGDSPVGGNVRRTKGVPSPAEESSPTKQFINSLKQRLQKIVLG